MLIRPDGKASLSRKDATALIAAARGMNAAGMLPEPDDDDYHYAKRRGLPDADARLLAQAITLSRRQGPELNAAKINAARSRPRRRKDTITRIFGLLRRCPGRLPGPPGAPIILGDRFAPDPHPARVCKRQAGWDMHNMNAGNIHAPSK